jgi:hypothetical protein
MPTFRVNLGLKLASSTFEELDLKGSARADYQEELTWIRPACSIFSRLAWRAWLGVLGTFNLSGGADLEKPVTQRWTGQC